MYFGLGPLHYEFFTHIINNLRQVYPRTTALFHRTNALNKVVRLDVVITSTSVIVELSQSPIPVDWILRLDDCKYERDGPSLRVWYGRMWFPFCSMQFLGNF